MILRPGKEPMQYSYAWVVLDLFAVLVLLLTVQRCASRGFLRTILGFFGYVAAAFLGKTFSGKLAEFLYQFFVRDILRVFFTRQLESILQKGTGNVVSVLEVVPGILQRVMQQTGKELLSVAFDGDITSMVQVIVDTALQEPVMTLLSGVSFFLIFSVSMFVVRRVGYLFSGVHRIPLIGTANTVLGGIVGVVEAVVLLYVIGIGLQLVIYATGGELPFLNRSVLDDTYIYRVFLNLS